MKAFSRAVLLPAHRRIGKGGTLQAGMIGPSLALGGRSCEGNLDHHLQTATVLAGRCEDAAAVQLHDAAAYREAKTAALVVGTRVIETNEALEDSASLLRIEARPLVIDGNAPDIREKLGSKRDAAIRWRGAHCVRQQVEKHLPHALFPERHCAIALVRVRKVSSMVLGQCARVLRECLQEGGRFLLLHVHAVDVLAGDIRNRLASQVVGFEKAVGHRSVKVDVKERRSGFRHLADSIVDRLCRQGLVVRAQGGLQLLELRFVELVQLVNELVLEKVIPCDEQAGERGDNRHRIPERDARTDRFHSSWYPTPRTVLKSGLSGEVSSFARSRLMYTSSRLVSTS